ncbi:hypothetical protein GEMRC1_004777 [Eukaryota sp. GEM-RC1]
MTDSSHIIVTPGDLITTEEDYLRGHGTNLKDNHLTAALTGVVQRLNKLISVQPYKSRYRGDVGDIVVGRVVEVANRRWKVDVGARQHAVLMLSAINLPSSEVRRRSALDELNMRKFYTEGNLITAEVQQIFHDGSLALHARRRYGKLDNGVFCKVHPSLIKRSPIQLITFEELSLEVVLGRNGFVWIGPLITEEQKNSALQGVGFAGRGHYHFYGFALEVEQTPALLRNMAYIRNVLSALDKEFITVSEDNIRKGVNLALELGFEPKDLLELNVYRQITTQLS